MTRRSILILSILLMSSVIFGQRKPNAGVLPYANHEGDIYILLSKEEGANKYWEDFIGEWDPKDKDSKKNTALREFMEETRYVFDSIDVREKLEKATELTILFTKNTFRYILEVQYIEERVILSKPFIVGETEKTEYCWVNLETILESVKDSEGPRKTEVPIHCKGEHLKLDENMHITFSDAEIEMKNAITTREYLEILRK